MSNAIGVGSAGTTQATILNKLGGQRAVAQANVNSNGGTISGAAGSTTDVLTQLQSSVYGKGQSNPVVNGQVINGYDYESETGYGGELNPANYVGGIAVLAEYATPAGIIAGAANAAGQAINGTGFYNVNQPGGPGGANGGSSAANPNNLPGGGLLGGQSGGVTAGTNPVTNLPSTQTMAIAGVAALGVVALFFLL